MCRASRLESALQSVCSEEGSDSQPDGDVRAFRASPGQPGKHHPRSIRLASLAVGRFIVVGSLLADAESQVEIGIRDDQCFLATLRSRTDQIRSLLQQRPSAS